MQPLHNLTVPALAGDPRIRHGFFARRGGVSGGIYASLNCGFGSNDYAADVAENRRRVAHALDMADTSLVTVHQIHSPDVVTVTAPWQPAQAPRADAMVSDRPGIALGVLTADCAPVLFADPAAGVVGAAHAGWRGALDGVIAATVAAMAALGARRHRICAAIGPCIAQPSYEVGGGFPAPFLAADATNDRFFIAAARPDHWQFDLPGFVLSQLAQAGIADPTNLGEDTYPAPELYFSYRRATHNAEPDYGRNLSVIALAAT